MLIINYNFLFSESKLSNKELPTSKWRRERRRTSEYHHQTQNPITFSNSLRTSQDNECIISNYNGVTDAPLDMTLTSKPRTPPPPYREPLPGSIFACASNRPSVITQAPPKNTIADIKKGDC